MNFADDHRSVSSVAAPELGAWCDECGHDWPCSVGKLREERDRLVSAIRGHRLRVIADQAEGDPAEIEYAERDMDLWATVDPPPETTT